MMKISIAEIFESIQGEATQAGEPALFIRLAGCNFWNGHQEARDLGAGDCSMWCDTDFKVKFNWSIEQVDQRIEEYRTKIKTGLPLVIFTGGEPTTQLFKLKELIIKKLKNTRISAETNGSKDCEVLALLVQHENGHVVCSPKKYRDRGPKTKLGSSLKLSKTNDLKLIVKRDGLKSVDWPIEYDNLFVQPIDTGDNGLSALEQTMEAAKLLGAKLSIQTHKFLGLR